MKISVRDGEVCVECANAEYLKLKTSLYLKLREALSVKKSSLHFPLSSFSKVQHLLSGADLPPEISQIAAAYAGHAVARERALEIIETGAIQGIQESWAQTLDPAQAVAVSAMILPNLLGLCLFDEQGSGKTVMTIAAFDALKSAGLIDAMIVVCPKSMLSEWPKDIEKFLPNKYKTVIAEGGGSEARQFAVRDFDVLATNYESVDRMRVALSATASRKSYLLVVDESFYLKNPDSLRSEVIGKLRDVCKRCFVLCGTPAPNSPYDLVNQFDLADLGYTFGGFSRTRNTEEDRTRIETLVEERGTFVRRLKTDVLGEVPDKNFHIIKVPISGRQAMMYDKARSSLELELRGLDNKSFKKQLVTYFQKRAVLLQICSIPSAVDPTMTEDSAKLVALDKLLADLIPQGRKVILWSFYRKSLDDLAARYAKYLPVRIDGSITSSTERREAVRLFQEDPTRMLFLGNPAAAGAGITLHASYDAVYVSYSNQAAHYLQSLDRIHRRGQKAKEVNYYLLVCEGTIEETEVIRLRGKELQQHSLLGDNIAWPTSLDEALRELSSVGV